MPGTRAGAYFVTTLSLGRAPAVAGSPGAPFNEGAKGTAAISRTNDLRSIEHPPRFGCPGAGDVTAPRGARSRRRRARGRVRVRLRTPPRPVGGHMKKMALFVMMMLPLPLMAAAPPEVSIWTAADLKARSGKL